MYGDIKDVVTISDGGGEPKKVISQKISPLVNNKEISSRSIYSGHNVSGTEVEYGLRPKARKSGEIKVTTISSPSEAFPEHKLVQIKRPDGFYSSARVVGNEVVGGYEVVPETRTFAQGFKGKLQKAAMALGSDANGCERPVLRKLAGFLLKRIK